MCESDRVNAETLDSRWPSCSVNRGSVGLISRSAAAVWMASCMSIRFSERGGRGRRRVGGKTTVRERLLELDRKMGQEREKEGNKVCKVTE